jgi:hypothetical protein
METATQPEAPQTFAEERRPYAALAGASTLGSVLGAGAGMLIGVGATDSLVGLLAAYPGAWIGAAVGADLTGAPRARSFVASTVGLVAGAAVMRWGGESWGWVGFGVHGLLTALVAGGAERPEAASGS